MAASLKSALEPKSNTRESPLAKDWFSHAGRSLLDFNASIEASSGLIGSKPALLRASMSMLDWYSQPIFWSIEPALALSAFFSAFSTSWR